MLDKLTHLNEHMDGLVAQYGAWVYLVLFVVIFAETGFSVPLLPGDSLLFAAGLLAHKPDGGLNLWLLYMVFFSASFAGDNVNYQIGRLIGKKLFRSENARIFKPSRLAKTHMYFELHGGKTVVLARFLPVLRNLAPFVAGMGRMTLRGFLVYECIGAALWSTVCVTAGFLFGRIPFVSEHPLWAIAGLLLLCAGGIAWEWIRFRKEIKTEKVAFQGNRPRR
jgi:membrane-associated protein